MSSVNWSRLARGRVPGRGNAAGPRRSISICQARFSPTTSPPDVEVVRWEGLGGVWRSGSLPPTVSKIPPQLLFPNLAFLCRERVQKRSEEHTSELQSLMRNSYAVFCLKKKNTKKNKTYNAKTRQKYT